MDERSYATTLTVTAGPAEVYDAINDVRGWWSEEIDGDTDAEGAEFVFHGHDPDDTIRHISRIRVAELVPGQRVVWRVLDNEMSFVADQSEWRGTEIRFELTGSGSGTEIRFSHVGLVPSYECYDACSSAWSFFVNQSLHDLLTSGRGAPITPATASA